MNPLDRRAAEAPADARGIPAPAAMPTVVPPALGREAAINPKKAMTGTMRIRSTRSDEEDVAATSDDCEPMTPKRPAAEPAAIARVPMIRRVGENPGRPTILQPPRQNRQGRYPPSHRRGGGGPRDRVSSAEASSRSASRSTPGLFRGGILASRVVRGTGGADRSLRGRTLLRTGLGGAPY